MFLNIIQLAESLGVEESVVEGWIRNEGLPCVRDSGRLFFDRAQVVVWATERGLAARAGFLAPTQTKASVTPLEKLFRIGGIWRGVDPTKVTGIFEEVLHRLPGTTPDVRRMLIQRMSSPNGITWAPVGRGWALPHMRSHVALGRESGLMALLLLNSALPLQDLPTDAVPITQIVFFIAPSPRAHLVLLAQLSTSLTRGELGKVVVAGASDVEIFSALSSPHGRPEAAA
jgi:PTS system nitrogen regulatory IIA component